MTQTQLNNLDTILSDIRKEVIRASTKHPPLNSFHEGYAVLFEEVDELWDEVKLQTGKRNLENMRTEAAQVGAMSVRFILDLLCKS